MKTFNFDIGITLPGLNEYTNANRCNKYAGAKMKKNVEKIISWYIKLAKHGEEIKFENQVSICIDWYDSTKRDPDNIIFAKKFICDALVSAGVLQNDNKKCISGFTDILIKSKDDRINVKIMETGESERLK